jgi:glutathione S-transferase
MTSPKDSVILWSYDASPFTQKALGLFAIKRLPFRWVETPMMPPKDDLMALTGGYRGTPVLQVGAEVFIDSQLIARELERIQPSPTLFPLGGGLELALVRWSDAFFRSALKIVLAVGLAQWPASFREDRQYLFPDIDFDSVGADAAHSRSQFRAHAALIAAQLDDGRAFLAGAAPGLGDVQAYPFVWMARGAFGDLAAELLSGFPSLLAWEQRMQALWTVDRQQISAATALAEARAARIVTPEAIDPADAQALRAGQLVDITPDDTRRGIVRGNLHVVAADRVVVRPSSKTSSAQLVHFPRLGYRVTPVA